MKAPIISGLWLPPRAAITTKTLRANVVTEARRDAAAYHREFRGAAGPEGTDWVAEAWADLRRHFKLDADTADRLWLVYWKAFSEETVRLASVGGTGE